MISIGKPEVKEGVLFFSDGVVVRISEESIVVNLVVKSPFHQVISHLFEIEFRVCWMYFGLVDGLTVEIINRVRVDAGGFKAIRNISLEIESWFHLICFQLILSSENKSYLNF